MNGSGKGARIAKITKISPHYAPMDTIIMLEVAPHYEATVYYRITATERKGLSNPFPQHRLLDT